MLNESQTTGHAQPVRGGPGGLDGRGPGRSDQSWIYQLTESDIAELDAAVARVEERGIDIMDINRDDFVLPTLAETGWTTIADEVVNGRGIGLIRGVPVDRYNRVQAAIAFWGIGTVPGRSRVPELPRDTCWATLPISARTLSRTRSIAATRPTTCCPFHCDACDLVVLMCLHPAKSGGSSRFTSTLNVYNEMLKRRPELVAELAAPIYRDRRNEIPEGKDPWWQLPIFNFYEDYLTVSAGGTYVRSAQRFEELPRHTEELKEALTLFADLCDELSYDMEFLQGDVQILHNHVTAHSRTEFEDYPEPERRRNLLRLWLGTPGGRPLPPAYSDRFAHLEEGERPAGGVVVPGTVYKAPLYPE